jgi:hypothetical protein
MKKGPSLLVLIVLLGFSVCGCSQLGMFSKEQRIELTREWKGERFPDGRLKVPDELLKRMKTVDTEEAWDVLNQWTASKGSKQRMKEQ